jgi:hypothetical protein
MYPSKCKSANGLLTLRQRNMDTGRRVTLKKIMKMPGFPWIFLADTIMIARRFIDISPIQKSVEDGQKPIYPIVRL